MGDDFRHIEPSGDVSIEKSNSSMPQSEPSPRKVSARTQPSPTAPPTVSGRWLLTALAISLPAAALCTWAVFCFLFWQGSWQLLYHPTSAIAHTPSTKGLAYDPVSFATDQIGEARLQGWWIPSPGARYTALYLHDQNGNLGDAVSSLASLHDAGLNVLAFDYRGYGQSHFEHPTEARWREDAEWALEYLTGTRHIDPKTIVIAGSGLGANLGLQTAAGHPELAGVVLISPIDSPANIIFNDPRSKLVPAHLLVHDRYDLTGPAGNLRIPSLWLEDAKTTAQSSTTGTVAAFEKVTTAKERVLIKTEQIQPQQLENWLNSITKR